MSTAGIPASADGIDLPLPPPDAVLDDLQYQTVLPATYERTLMLDPNEVGAWYGSP
jgi:hypothetical protein